MTILNQKAILLLLLTLLASINTQVQPLSSGSSPQPSPKPSTNNGCLPDHPTECKACDTTGYKCTSCKKTTDILKMNGDCVSCNTLQSCNQCFYKGCEVCNSGSNKYFDKTQNLYLCKADRSVLLDWKLWVWIGIPLLIVVIVLIVVIKKVAKKERDVDLYEKLISGEEEHDEMDTATTATLSSQETYSHFDKVE